VQRAARAAGYDLVERHFYSPLPQAERLPDALWAGPRELPGVDLRIEEAIVLLRGELRPHLAEFRPPRTAAEARPGGFHLDNGGYESVDAETLYAMLRHARPARVVELGSGASSHVIDLARRANEHDGHPFAHAIFDPYPFAASPLGPVPGARVSPVRAEDLDAAEVLALRSGDVLFVDTTHTVRTGGDVTRILLELVPLLAPGVLVHVHDVFLPWEYPRAWVVGERRAWAEQYLLQAFLAFNSEWEVVLPAHAVARAAPELLHGLIPSFGSGVSPGAFWMRRRRGAGS
jgi:hypothetical protein